MREAQRGFTLVEVLTVAGMGILLAGMALPSLQLQVLKSRRADAVAALTRVQLAQEQYRSHHGLYATELRTLRTAVGDHSAEGLYRIALQASADGYVVTADATERQAADRDCPRITLSVESGFARFGPSPSCWGR